jgi:predicted alpha/beta-hydrolase family hydrolase
MVADSPREFRVEIEGSAHITALFYPAHAGTTPGAAVILAHGAGANQRHPFMTTFAHGLSRRGLDIFTFNFPYMERKRHVPDKMPRLVVCYREVLAAARAQTRTALERFFIGGKSMGGRVATHVAAEDPSLPIAGLVLLGYPLHPPGQPAKTRDAHLPAVKRPMLFVQGSRDTFGTPSELKPILGSLDPLPTLHTVQNGDHSFKIGGTGASRRQPDVYDEVADTIVEWIAATP